MHMRTTKTVVVSGVAALIAFSAAGTAASAEQASDVEIQHYPCGSSRPPNRDTQGSNGVWPKAIRDLAPQSGSAYSCSDLATIYHGDRLDYYCWTVGSDNAIWTYVSAFDRGTAGWVLDNKLSPTSQGSANCPT